jgi:quercetin dioxygenase-like cupin family protein
MTASRTALVGLVVLVAFGGLAAAHEGGGDKTLLDNDQVLVMEIVFPPGFKGDEHEAPVHELAYVLEGQFSVVTKGKGKTVVKKGQVEYAPKGTVHYSVNESNRPARVLVVMLKER